ncbi:MAG: addiction module protein [Desulfobulbaceae bacterium]|nr:addiction module protein [Desulfobulbaceae bacterium]
MADGQLESFWRDHHNSLSDIDSAWIAEAEQRYQEYKAGKRPGIEAQEVFAEADQRLK